MHAFSGWNGRYCNLFYMALTSTNLSWDTHICSAWMHILFHADIFMDKKPSSYKNMNRRKKYVIHTFTSALAWSGN